MDYRNDFFEFDDVTYLDVAGQGPLPRAAARAMEKAIECKKRPDRMPKEIYFALPDRVRALVAQLVGGKPEEVAVTTGASAGLAAIAQGLDWRPGDEVLVAAGEFPAHFAAFAPLADAGVFRLRVVEPRDRYVTAEDFLAALGDRTRLVSASLVRYESGARIDAARLAAGCRSAGALLALDLSQCAGAMPVELGALGADFAVAAGYKWLLSPYGTGFFWIREEWIERLRPAPFYWQALPGASHFASLAVGPYRPGPGARRWDAPETASASLAAMEASLEWILRVGAESVERHNRVLTEQLIKRLPRDRCVLGSPAEARARGPFVCVAGRSPEKTRALHERLEQERIIVSLRENALRIAPHLFNTPADIERLARALAA
jgi:selenocysteine lyase/cysteine desulfurase